MLALGATRWETIWKVVIPSARAGIVGAAILGLGRAVGETMAVTMVIGSSQSFGLSLTHLGTTLPATIVLDFTDASDPLAIAGIYELALMLLVISMALNVLARMLVWTVNRRYAN
jgi:phosphate transport system permease protein